VTWTELPPLINADLHDVTATDHGLVIVGSNGLVITAP
jgi:hypothetical protein